MKTIQQLTSLYSLSKTLRFELKPVGKTVDNIETRGLIAQDEQRAKEYVIVKDIIDRYHKTFITMCLEPLTLEIDDLKKYVELSSRSNRSAEDDAKLNDVKTVLRKQIVEAFKRGGSYNDLFKKELIQNHLPLFVDTDEEREIVDRFSKFTTYFTGFYENRKNMYSGEDKSTAIAYRLIHENLPTFVDNMKSFAKIAESEESEHFADIEAAFSEYLNVESIRDMFRLDYFSDTLTQEQIDVYNAIIGGKTIDETAKLKGLNEYVNLYNQQHRDNRLPLLKPLYKMILSDRRSLSWLTEEFDSDESMLRSIVEAHDMLHGTLFGDDEESLRTMLQNIDTYDLEHIYISNDLGLTDISQQIFGAYDVYTSAIKRQLQDNTPRTPKEIRNHELFNERINKLFKTAKSFSITYLNSFVEEGKTIQKYYKQLGAYDRDGRQETNLFTKIELAYIAAADIFAGHHGELRQSEDDTKLIKDLLDSYKSLQHFIKPLLGSGDEAEKDNEFYARLRNVWDALDIMTPLYNRVRNWLTRKPYSTEKFKLNFENNGTLLSGWVDSKTDKSDNGTQYGGYLFRKKNDIGEYDYYLGISADTKLFRPDDTLVYEDGMYERLDYYQVKAQTIFGGSYVGDYSEDSQRLLNAFRDAAKSMNEDINTLPVAEEKVPHYLKRIKAIGTEVYNRLVMNKSVAEAYANMKENIVKTLSSLKRVPYAIELSHQDHDIDTLFDKIMTMPSKSFGFYPVATSSITAANERDNKPLYLFKISNKDLSFAETFAAGLRKRRGTDNLHTMIFRSLLTPGQGVYDIGTGEVFYRRGSLDVNSTTIHKANKSIMNKNHNNDKAHSTFEYDIIKDRRYTCDKFSFHLSIKANYSEPKTYDVSTAVHDIIRHGGIKHIIGIDRGERHLLYLSLIDMKGNIVKQMTLNDIVNEYNGREYKTNYKDMLADREGNRTEARRNWKKIENIKDLKQGYLSQVVHIISKMMVEYDAIVVLEDLNQGFMRGRQKIERSVYEQFEKMLIDKLNYYVDKQKETDEAGGLLHALQLTSKFESFKKLGKQSGCLFYIPAWNTSKIDPVTGFVNLFDTRYENVDKARKFFGQFDSIRYNETKDWFEFAFDYNNFPKKAEGTRTRWTLCTYGERISTFRNPAKFNQWDNESVFLTEAFKKALADAGIDIMSNLKESICSLTDKKHLEPLMHLMKLLLQMRNSITNSEVDYLLSPIADDDGNFYDSRTCTAALPQDADANGAYNIARKGLWVVRKIQQTPADQKLNLAITNKEWLQFAQQKPYLND